MKYECQQKCNSQNKRAGQSMAIQASKSKVFSVVHCFFFAVTFLLAAICIGIYDRNKIDQRRDRNACFLKDHIISSLHILIQSRICFLKKCVCSVSECELNLKARLQIFGAVTIAAWEVTCIAFQVKCFFKTLNRLPIAFDNNFFF